MAAAHGRPEEENIEVAPRQAPGDAPPRGSARERLPGRPAAEATTPRLPELQAVPRARRRAAHDAGSLVPRIAVDALGGDRGPAEVIAGALEAAQDRIEVVLYGPPGLETQGLRLVEAPDVIEMHEKPADAVRA